VAMTEPWAVRWCVCVEYEDAPKIAYINYLGALKRGVCNGRPSPSFEYNEGDEDDEDDEDDISRLRSVLLSMEDKGPHAIRYKSSIWM
jgi:hypothetical protein